VHHDIALSLAESSAEVEAVDRIEFDLSPPRPVEFVLNRSAIVDGADVPIHPDTASKDTSLRRYRVQLAPGSRGFTLRWRVPRENTTVPFLWLDGGDAWHPQFDSSLVTFTMAATLPDGWSAVSQARSRPGNTPRTRVFRVDSPQEAIHLVAARFAVYRRDEARIEAAAYLLEDDAGLARRYLDATAGYLREYEQLLGPYPYDQFALVENTEPTGLGYPSFTLLGQRIIRLPFILNSSYPHEILHNWWGNSVYVDPEKGNWSEGLTAYLSDHYFREKNGAGDTYRRNALQQYRNYVDRAKDFPLTDFRARYDRASQAVGYGKSLMFFHMLRRRLGDDRFFECLRSFYIKNRFRRASYSDLRKSCETVAGADLSEMFDQWIRRTGAPAIAVSEVESIRAGQHWRVAGELAQVQEAETYTLNVPVVLEDAGGHELARASVSMSGRKTPFHLDSTSRPHRLVVDPGFDVFRRVDLDELPPSVGELLGTGEWVFVVPRGASEDELNRYRRFAAAWPGPRTLIYDDEPVSGYGGLWLLGWNNRLRDEFKRSLPGQDLVLTASAFTMDGEQYRSSQASVVLASRVSGRPWLWSGLSGTQDVHSIASRIRHYGQYSYVIFVTQSPARTGQWKILDSPLIVTLPDID